MIEFKIRKRNIDALIEFILQNDPDADIPMVRKAYEVAKDAHEGQFRLSGEPFIIHPLEVAINLAELKMDVSTISAALLHDVVEDTRYSLKYIEENFGEDVAMMVDGVTKISSIKSKSKATAQAETLRKMLLATIKDVRVIIIKLADKLHNMSTLMFQPPHKQERIARETLDIYAPIARRLGIYRLAGRLEDLSFKVIDLDSYEYIREKIDQRSNELEEYIENIRQEIISKLATLNISVEIKTRAKTFYSIYRKMMESNKSFDDIYDIRGIRIITREVKDCYAVLGVIHSTWTPIEGRFKDYIAVPKSNMYQSLHTTVIGPAGFPLEVQIRTKDMDATAEIGIAAHWVYKDGEESFKKDSKKLAILNNLSKMNLQDLNSRDFVSTFKMDLYEDEIFVFTPQGKIVKLAEGATPVDFAYAIHTEVGNKCSGAKINGKMVTLKTKLTSGDIVEILTSKNAKPSATWLKFVKSSNARYKIRSWIRKKNEESGCQDEDSRQKDSKKAEPKKVNVSLPDEDAIRLRKYTKDKNSGIAIEGNSNVLINLAQCCQPIPGDDVVGFITRGRGISVHKKKCPSLVRLQSEKERFINIVWEENDKHRYPVKISIKAVDRPNLLKEVTDEISLASSNILKIDATVGDGGKAELKFIIEVSSQEHLSEILGKIKRLKAVNDAYKLNEKVIIK